jgi:hypothetical protein
VRSYQFLIQSRNSPRTMQSDGSLLCSQQPANCPCHRQDHSGTHPLIPFKIYCNILPSVSGFAKSSVSFRHLHKTIYASVLCPVTSLWHFKVMEQRCRNSRSRPLFGLCQNLFVASVRSTPVPLTAFFGSTYLREEAFSQMKTVNLLKPIG